MIYVILIKKQCTHNILLKFALISWITFCVVLLKLNVGRTISHVSGESKKENGNLQTQRIDIE